MSDSLEDLLTADHRVIDGLLKSIGQALAAGSMEAAGAQCRVMAGSLGHHMEWEESDLFPAVPPSARMSARHVESLLIDHERIRRTIQELGLALEGRQLQAARESLDDLTVFLAGHNDDEELGIYREADRVLGDEVKIRLARSFRRN